jgi:NADH-quinone oxidoreductase subunit J
MLLDTSGAPRALPRRLPLVARVLAGGLVASGVLSFSARAKLPVSEAVAAAPGVGGALKPYAYQLFTTYLLPVQILGFLLLAAMLGVIVLSKKFEGLEDVK